MTNSRVGSATWVIVLAALLVACQGPTVPREVPGAVDLPRGGADEALPVPGECHLGAVRFGLVSPGTPEEQAQRFAPLETHLGSLLGARTEVVAYQEYDELITDVIRGELDVAQLPPLAFVLARERDDQLLLLATLIANGDVRYAGYLVVRRDSDVQRLLDLQNKRVAFTSPTSASGFVFPLARLAADGVDVPHLMTRARLNGSHRQVIQAVVDGEVDAAATYRGGLEAARDAGIDTRTLRVLGITAAIPQEALVAHARLPAHHVACLRRAFLLTNRATVAGRQALARFTDADGWTVTDEHFYDVVREQLYAVRKAAPGVTP